MDIILLFSGLSFLILGLLILIWPKHESEYSFANFLWLLGLFGLSHGAFEWLELWRASRGGTPLLNVLRPGLLLVSYLFLFEFGRRLFHASLHPVSAPVLPGRRGWLWLYAFVLGIIFSASALSNHSLNTFAIFTHYFAGLPAAVLTGLGFYFYWRGRVKPSLIGAEQRWIDFAIKVTALSFIVYGALNGLVVPRADWFPASVLNTQAFRDTFHFPVQVAQALCALLIAVSLIYILRIFDIESRKRLVLARTASERDKERLERASRQNELLLQTASDGIHVLDLDGNVVEANTAFCRMLGYTRDEVLRMNVKEWDAHFSADELKARIPMLMGKLTVFETRHRRRDGKLIDVEISTVGVHIDGQALLYCSSRDITDRKHAEEQLRLVARAFDRAAEGVMITDAKQTIITVNDAFTAVTGYSREEAIGKTPALLQSGKQSADFYKAMWQELHARGWWQGEIWNRRKNGELYLEWLSINTVRDEAGDIINYIGMFSDITIVKQSHLRMQYLATYDELTDLPNRTLFNDQLRQAFARAARAGRALALLFVDLDNFKMINDTLGHEEGDALLRQVASRLKTCTREADTVARLGGDEFVILLEIERRDEAEIMAKRIAQAFASNFKLKEHACFISPSIGISLFPDDATDPKILMRHADTAMYRAKEHGKNTHMFFTADMAEQISQHMRIENALRQAILNGELFLEYQPQINLGDHSVTGIEALLRWRHQDNVLLPDKFIRIAEGSGLIVDIDEWVIGEVCRQLRAWDADGLPPLQVSINISARHFRRPDIYSRITGIIALAGIAPRRLCLEITEGVLMDMEDASRMLDKLHQAGFRISVDDFGTGFSSLSYLKRLPIHEIKVDRGFVDGIADDADDRAIATAIIAMARSLGLHTVGEGVESALQEAELKKLGCDIGQGFYYSRPLPAAQLHEWLLARRG